MRYWVHVNNQVQGPFDKEKLGSVAGLTLASMAYPEVPAGGEAAAWKAISAYPELLAAMTPSPSPAPAPTPAPAPARPAQAESPLALTMRGSLVGDPIFEEPLPAQAAKPVLVTTGTLEPAVEKAAPAQPDPRLAQLRLKIGQLGAELAAAAEAQAQLAGKLAAAVKELKELSGE